MIQVLKRALYGKALLSTMDSLKKIERKTEELRKRNYSTIKTLVEKYNIDIGNTK